MTSQINVSDQFGIVGGQYGEFEDLNRDGVIDNADLDIMILDIIHTLYGDANLSGTVDISDVSIWNSSKFVQATRWSQADFNADGVVDVTDFIIWQAHKFTASAYIHTEVTAHQFGFTGRMFDTATGLQNNLNRWYVPAVGRWISKDPIEFAAGDANLYRYVGNKVANATDPTGLRIIEDIVYKVLKFFDGEGARLNTEINKANARRACRSGGDPAGIRDAQTQFADEAADEEEVILKVYEQVLKRGLRPRQ